jgi:hypothetical protein
MQNVAFAFVAVLFASIPCWAEVSIYSNIAGKMDVSYSLPNGAKQSFPMEPGWGGALTYGASYNLPGALQDVDVTIADDLGTAVWSGKIRNWACMFLFKTADGKTHCIPAGWGLSFGKMPQAVRFFNVTGQPLEVNLQGGGGLKGCQVALKPVLDTEQITRLPEGEDNYYAQFSGNKSDTVINPGWVYLVYKTSEGKYEVKRCGAIKTPDEVKTD